MWFKLYLMLVICQVYYVICDSDTAYHYISQVSDTTPETLNPKPLFSPHDPRRVGTRSRGVYSYQSKIDKDYRYGTEHHPIVSTEHNLLQDGISSTAIGQDQRLWYPVYADVQYPGWLGVSPASYDLSYGALPSGYEPVVPLRGNPLGYSYTYSANDHKSQMTSDGKGNFYSSFSFVPPPGSTIIQSHNLSPLDDSVALAHPHSIPSNIPTLHTIPSGLDYDVHPTSVPPAVNIPAVNPNRRVYPSAPYNPSTARPIYSATSPSTVRPVYISPSNSVNSRPVDITTGRPLVGPLLPNPVNDFTNGFNFVAKNYPSRRIPENTFNLNSHALSTNIQHDSLARESSAKTNNNYNNNAIPTGSRHVTIVPPDPVQSSVTTEGSYQTLSRSLPLAFSAALTTLAPVKSYSTEKPWSSPFPRRFTSSYSSTTTEKPWSSSISRRFKSVSPSSSTSSYSTETPWSSPLYRRFTSESPSSYSTERPWNSLAPRRFPTDKSRSSSVQTIRNASRRSTTEGSVSYAASRRSTTVLPPSSTKKPSFVQKIPRKLKNKTSSEFDESSRPNFIDDLTSLAYSTDNVSLKNNSIIQIKQKRDKILVQLPDVNEKTLVHNKSAIIGVHLNNSSGTIDNIIKDGYVTGNKTYLAGLGLRTNIHY